MIKKITLPGIGVTCLSLIVWACTPSVTQRNANKSVPANYNSLQNPSKSVNGQQAADTTNTADVDWKNYFTDPDLIALIDTALLNNQELNIMRYEINIARAEVRAKKGMILPSVGLRAGAGAEKAGRYTRNGAVDENVPMEPGKKIPEVLPNYVIAADLSWEVDIWKKLRNAKKSAVNRYLASIDGQKFMITNLVAEIAGTYYELLALDNQLDILKKNIDIQNNALKAVKLEKESAKVTELAVRRFEAQVYYTQSLQYDIQQKITETENKLNFLVGRYPTPIKRNFTGFINTIPDTIHSGVPSQLLENRYDVKKAEYQLEAAKLDVKVAKANFYPVFRITGGLGYEAFNPKFLISSPESMIFSLAGTMVAPLINRNEIKAVYLGANAKQIQAAYNYERTVLNAYVEVSNQLAKINNLGRSYNLKTLQVDALNESVTISNRLFTSARADYMEVLLTQRDALESKMELIETKKEQINAMVYLYRALGGG
jgi:multidrug efflux system outer membrane protein